MLIYSFVSESIFNAMELEALEKILCSIGNDEDTDTVLASKPQTKTEKPPLYKVLLLNDDYTSAEQIIFDLSENFYNDYFIAKGFLLLAKIYKNKGNRLQSKATLESIIDNYNGNDLVDEALMLRNMILQEEKEEIDRKLEYQQSYINIFEDDIDYEMVEE